MGFTRESGKEENVFRHSGRRKNPFLLSVPFTHRKFSEVIATFCCNSRRSFACIIKIVIFQYVVITFTITDYYLPKNKCFTINSWTSKWFVNSKNFWVEVSSLLLRNERCQLCSVMAEIHCNSFLSSFFLLQDVSKVSVFLCSSSWKDPELYRGHVPKQALEIYSKKV